MSQHAWTTAPQSPLTQRPQKAHTPASKPHQPSQQLPGCPICRTGAHSSASGGGASGGGTMHTAVARSGGRPRWHAATANSMRCTTVRGGTHSGGKRSAPAPKRLTYAHREPSEEEDNLQLSVYGHSGAVVCLRRECHSPTTAEAVCNLLAPCNAHR